MQGALCSIHYSSCTRQFSEYDRAVAFPEPSLITPNLPTKCYDWSGARKSSGTGENKSGTGRLNCGHPTIADCHHPPAAHESTRLRNLPLTESGSSAWP